MLKKPSYFSSLLSSIFLPFFLHSSDDHTVPTMSPGIYVINQHPGQPRRLISMEQITLTPRSLTFTQNNQNHNTTSEGRRIPQQAIARRVMQERQAETARELLRAQSRQEYREAQQAARQRARQQGQHNLQQMGGSKRTLYACSVPHSTAPTQPGTPVPEQADPSNELGNVVQALSAKELIEKALKQIGHLGALLERPSPFEEVIFFDPTDQTVPSLPPAG